MLSSEGKKGGANGIKYRHFVPDVTLQTASRISRTFFAKSPGAKGF